VLVPSFVLKAVLVSVIAMVVALVPTSTKVSMLERHAQIGSGQTGCLGDKARRGVF